MSLTGLSGADIGWRPLHRTAIHRTVRQGEATDSCKSVFGHPGKSASIDLIWAERDRLFAEYLAAEDKVAFLQTLSWIGPVTKLHLAKNFGGDFAKPDVHLNRLAEAEGTTAQALCERLGGGLAIGRQRSI